jgi:hypothetical protein
MYSFLFDQTYINLLILVIIVSLVMFLWRKLIILEGNFFVLEKRVNLIKKDAREDSISRNIEKSDVIMNEIFNDYYPSNACKQSKCGGGMSVCVPSDNNPDDENMVQFADVITFANGGNIVLHSATEGDVGDVEAVEADEAVEAACVSFTTATTATAASVADATDAIEIDRMVDTIISSSEEYEKKFREDADGDADTMSVSSEITFTSDEKKNEKKKYAKMSLDKLKDLCNQGNLNNDGTRNQLITRIIEAKK